jgi:hypothetical protein
MGLLPNQEKGSLALQPLSTARSPLTASMVREYVLMSAIVALIVPCLCYSWATTKLPSGFPINEAGITATAPNVSNTSWHQYVRSPSSKQVFPVRLVESLTTGNVSNTEQLFTDGNLNGVTVLDRNTYGTSAPVV